MFSETQKSYATHVSPALSFSSCGWPSVCGTLHCRPPGRFSDVASSHLSLWHTLTNTFLPNRVLPSEEEDAPEPRSFGEDVEGASSAGASSKVFATKPALGITSCTSLP